MATTFTSIKAAVDVALDDAFACGVRITATAGSVDNSPAAWLVIDKLCSAAAEDLRFTLDDGGEVQVGAAIELGVSDHRTWFLEVDRIEFAIDEDGLIDVNVPEHNVTFTLREDGRGGQSLTYQVA